LCFVVSGFILGLIALYNFWLSLLVLLFAALGYGAALLYFLLFAPVELLASEAPLSWKIAGIAGGILVLLLLWWLGWKLLILVFFVLVAYLLSKVV